MIGTASSEERRALAVELGADVAIDPAPEGLSERLIEANAGEPVDVVFDMAGGATFDASYEALARFGRIVVCGISSEEPNRVSTGSLLRSSRAVVGFYLFDCLQRPGMFGEALRICSPVSPAVSCRLSSVEPTRLATPPRHRSTCAGGARRASCCWTRRCERGPAIRHPRGRRLSATSL